jgi:hypothetical protein
VKAYGAERGELGQALDDVGLEGIEAAFGSGWLGIELLAQCAAHHGVVDAETARHRLDAPAIDQHEPPHLSAHLGGDHR